MSGHALVVAKAPAPGQVKTRLGVDVGMSRAAEVAAAALLDTVQACTAAFGAERCHVALAGDLATATRAASLDEALAGWDVFAQRGEDFAARLANAHLDLAGRCDGPVVQVGMDTPQVTPAMLRQCADALDPRTTDAVLGPTPDGGWWVLALRDPGRADVLREVPMSTPTTYDDTLRALTYTGLRVAGTASLRDVDTVHDADLVAREFPGTLFAQLWAASAGSPVSGTKPPAGRPRTADEGEG